MLKAVILPGMDGTGSLLSDFVQSLGRHFDVQVVAYPPDEPLGYRQLHEFVRARLPAGEFVLIAESFSGPIALSLAREASAGMKALVLCASFARVDLPGKAWLSRCASFVPFRSPPVSMLSILLWGRWRTRERVDALRLALSHVHSDVIRVRAIEALSVDATRDNATVAVPTLCLQASQDRLIGQSAAKVLAGIVPGMQVHRFDAPHFLLQIRAEECAQVVATFVSEVRSGL
ncbi:lysophospholipase [Lysobacter sp. MMG2]|uniref:alpha/beta fold hydrolase n=1 Tax=Lysobacter sp. MMG2 TaxID=2801338 RepID=UPI001C22D272|nr:alpha/beta hydrolase [Lysobacter sp. MMG2]MBU8974688.1 lysophospholipase [Lysobacter sp. MMG2]